MRQSRLGKSGTIVEVRWALHLGEGSSVGEVVGCAVSRDWQEAQQYALRSPANRRLLIAILLTPFATYAMIWSP